MADQLSTLSIPSTHSPASFLASLDESLRNKILRKFTDGQLEDFRWDWRFWARPGQLPPGTPRALEQRTDWVHWLPLAGRGWGKTKVGAQTVRSWDKPGEIINMVGPTASSVRSVMIEGESGLLSCYPPDRRPEYIPSLHQVKFPGGAVGFTFSADEPERLRGPQCTKYWADEPCAWRFLDDAWDNLMFGFRLGDDTRGICTTTPKPVKWLMDLIANPATVTTRHSSYENRANLAPAFFADIVRKYEGTRIGRQELMAEILTDVPGALWTRTLIDATRGKPADVIPEGLIRIVVAIDPAVTSKPESDETGIIVAALTRNWHVLILDDLSCRESPLGWAKVAIAAYRARRADRIVCEVNNGGDLVTGNIRGVDPNVSVRSVRASRGKYIRAEPVAALYEQGRVHHIGTFGTLEDQMCGWTPQSGEKSPDRMDALVWAVTELLIDIDDAPMGLSPVGEFQISSI
jgi:phage terminase large subunit-like protein